MTRDIFLGRTEEQQQFRRVLRSHQPLWFQRHLPTLSQLFAKPTQKDHPYPFVLLFHGEGGMGKTTLMRRLRWIVETEKGFKDEFNVLFLDWEARQGRTPGLTVGHDNIHPETVMEELHKAMVDADWGEFFKPYRDRVQEIRQVEEKVEKQLRSQPQLDLPKEVSNLSASGLAFLIRTAAAFNPAIGLLDQLASSPGLKTGVATTLNVSAEGLHQARLFVQNALSQKEYDTYSQPHERLAEALGKGIADLAKRKPLVLLLDTYEIVDRPECDYTLRTVIRYGGDRVVWAIAGRANLADSGQRGNVYFRGYQRDLPEDRLISRAMSEFGLSEIQEYFRGVVPEQPITEPQADAIARFSLGIPFVISEAAAMWREGNPIEAIVAPVSRQLGSTTAREQVIRATSERFLVHCFGAQERERDLQAVYALAMMRRPSVELLKEMLEVSDLERELQSLKERYSFIWVEQVRLDEKLAGFLREYLLAEVRRRGERVQKVNDRAIVWLQLDLEDLSRNIADTADCLEDDRIAETMIDLAYHFFWRSEAEGWRYLVPRFVEGWQYDRRWTRSLLEFIERFAPTFSRDGQHRLQLMADSLIASPDLEDIQNLLAELEKLTQRQWLEGEHAEEHKAILLLQKGQLLYRQEDYQAALRVYLEVERRLPTHTLQLRNHLAEALYSLSRKFIWSQGSSDAAYSSEGEQAIEKAIALNSNATGDYYYRLGAVKSKLGEVEEAIAAYQRAIELNPKYASPHHGLGKVYRTQGKLEEAIAAYQRAIELDPKFAYPHNGLGNVYSDQGKLEEAIAAYQSAIELDPKDAYPHNGLGNVYSDQGKLEEAIAAYQSAIELDSKACAFVFNLGSVYALQDEMDEARNQWRDGLALCEGVSDYEKAFRALYTIALGRHRARDR